MVPRPCTDHGTDNLPLKLPGQLNYQVKRAYYCHINLLVYKEFTIRVMKIYTKIILDKDNNYIDNAG